MKKVSLAILLLAFLAMIPATAFAETPVFYCSSAVAGPGDGSYDNPWRCATQEELNAVITNVCTYGYAILYQTVSGGYYRHTIEDPNDGACTVTSSVFYYGYPPDTGISLPAPLVVGGALALGAALLAGGIVIYRKRTA